MAVLLPLLKAVLPHVTQIATLAIPAFTKKPEVAKVDPVVAKQIEELQAAATKNAESIHVLAEKLQQSIQGVDEGAGALQKEITALKKWVLLSTGVAALALILALWLALRVSASGV